MTDPKVGPRNPDRLCVPINTMGRIGADVRQRRALQPRTVLTDRLAVGGPIEMLGKLARPMPARASLTELSW